jgi:hypothetical protein
MTWRKCEEIRISTQKDCNFLQALGTQGLDWTCAENNSKLKNVNRNAMLLQAATEIHCLSPKPNKRKNKYNGTGMNKS